MSLKCPFIHTYIHTYIINLINPTFPSSIHPSLYPSMQPFLIFPSKHPIIPSSIQHSSSISPSFQMSLHSSIHLLSTNHPLIPHPTIHSNFPPSTDLSNIPPSVLPSAHSFIGNHLIMPLSTQPSNIQPYICLSLQHKYISIAEVQIKREEELQQCPLTLVSNMLLLIFTHFCCFVWPSGLGPGWGRGRGDACGDTLPGHASKPLPIRGEWATAFFTTF